ncbi:MAG: hypothetical protein ACRDSN_03880 [Pseudonocardiaceae bacterium]
MPTYELPDSVYAEYAKLSREQRRAFRRALARFIEALRHHPARLPSTLRVKGVEGHPGVFEMSFAADGRATFEYGEEVQPGEPHVIWRRVGDHSIFRRP